MCSATPSRFAGDDPVAVRASVAGRFITLRVSDHGPGIPKEELERVFEPFHRSRERGEAGSGLGLAIARGFVEANGGRLRAESLPGQGTTFVFQLPVPAEAPGGAMTAARRILVCDDEPQILRALKVILRDAGFEVVATATAEEALDAVAVRPPDAAIIDLILPDGDGIEVCRSIREWSEMPILVLSAVGEEPEKVRALDAGADDYVTKPFGPSELIARLNAALRRAQAAEDARALTVDGLEIDLAARKVTPRRGGGPPDPDRVRPAARAGSQPRPPDHPPGAAHGGLGSGLGADTQTLRVAHREPAPQDRARPGHAPLHPHRPGRGLPIRRSAALTTS